jgi:8-amino-7-oxononanoate synthase
MLTDRLERTLTDRAHNNRLRSLTLPDSKLVDLSSNDYLGFSRDPTLRNAYLTALSDAPYSPYGPASSRLLDGTTKEHADLEMKCAQIFDAEAALLFNSGFDAVRPLSLRHKPLKTFGRTSRSFLSCPAS